jgi:hypothetical protein
MLCKVRFTTVDPKEDFGKYAMHVTESETGREWEELRFDDDSVLTSVLTNLRATEEQKVNLFEHLSKESGSSWVS